MPLFTPLKTLKLDRNKNQNFGKLAKSIIQLEPNRIFVIKTEKMH